MAAPDKLVIVTRRPPSKNWSSDSTPATRRGSTSSTWAAASTTIRTSTTPTIMPLAFLQRRCHAACARSGSTARFCRRSHLAPSDVVVILGQDGLVVNAAKYLNGQLVVALNPDPARIDGVLLPFDFSVRRRSDRPVRSHRTATKSGAT